MPSSVFNLKVQKFDKVCSFELAWGESQQLSITLTYPEKLTRSYQEWQRSYLNFYKTALRGRVEEIGSIAPTPIDFHAKLVQAEAQLLYEFNHWLRSAELYKIRAAIAQANKNVETTQQSIIDIFLTCNSPELARLPWEAWEIATEFAISATKIHIIRQPLNIQEKVAQPKQRPGKARVLAIFGDDTGLNLQVEKDTLRSLDNILSVTYIDKKNDQGILEFQEEIIKTIAAQPGWDILFFTGHSDETTLTGGEIFIAPNVSMTMSELEPSLKIAKQQGLQFAIFNSCNGLSIANYLIDLGLSQVAVMREKIHNRVAEDFLVKFLQAIAEYKDVHSSLIIACQYLKNDKNIIYPSAYLIPSLFCHPKSSPFRLKPNGFRDKIKQWLPKTKEAIALTTLAIFSSFYPINNSLLDNRVWMQSVYRQATNQIPSTPQQPPVLLVQIDQESLKKAKITAREINPINRVYLAQLIDKLTEKQTKVIGIDYLLDSPTPEEKILANSIKKSINQNNTWFIFGAILHGGKEQGVTDSVASLQQVMQAESEAYPWYLPLPSSDPECLKSCPFPYLLALASSLNQNNPPNNLPQPQQPTKNDFRTEVMGFVKKTKTIPDLTKFLHQLHQNPLASFSENFGQMWLHPITDYSIPPDRIFQPISAWELLENNAVQNTSQQIALIGAGGYDQSDDNFPMPSAIAYWRSQDARENPPVYTGTENVAYAIHHLMRQHLVIHVPDLWILAIAAICGKGAQLLVQQRQDIKRRTLLLTSVGGTAIYGLVGLQIYISAGVLFPWFLPSLAFWVYVLPMVRRKSLAKV